MGLSYFMWHLLQSWNNLSEKKPQDAKITNTTNSVVVKCTESFWGQRRGTEFGSGILQNN